MPKEPKKTNKEEREIKETSDESMHWADQTARRIIEEKGDKESYTVAAGITPSGTVHIGNFREIITVDLVARALKSLGKQVRFIYSWDDYDVFRKVPANMPKQELLNQYLRKPITDTPDTFDCKHESYAKHNEAEIEEVLPKVGIKPEFIYQSRRYRKSDYAEQIKHALKNKEKIKQILDKFREEPLEEDWLPVSVFCNKCGKDTIAKISYDGENCLSYECECGNKENIDIRKSGNAKLLWRIDWPMRWSHEKVDFEPGGKDHSTVGGSFSTAQNIVKIFNFTTPVYQMYDFVRIKGAGGKISSSSGNVITINQVLEVYEPEMVRWLFAGTRPNAEFAISFDADVIKLYEDFDKCERIYFGEQKAENEKKEKQQKRIYELSAIDKIQKKLPYQPSFRHLTNILQINKMNTDKTIGYYESQLKDQFDRERLRTRAECAKNWLEKYAPEDFKFSLQEKVSPEVRKKLSEKQKQALHKVAEALKKKKWDDKELHEEFYIIIENSGLEIGEFFKAAYNVLINKDKGPKLAAFLIEIGDTAKKLFESI